MYSRSDREGYHKGSQPQMILFHHTTVQKVMLVGLECGAINLHTCIMSSLRRSVCCVKVLGMKYVPNSLAMSPGPNTGGSHICTYTCWCQHNQHYSVLKHWALHMTRFIHSFTTHTLVPGNTFCIQCTVFMVGSPGTTSWSGVPVQFFGEMVCSTKQSDLSYSSQ